MSVVTGSICPECHEPPNFLHAGYCSKAGGRGVKSLVKGKAIDPRKGNWMQTYTGRAFYPYDMRVEDFCIEDIAHALSMLCRYGGHSRYFYSVAEHSHVVSHLVRPKHALAGLMHDATEAYLVDMPRPIKIGFPQYREMEAKIWHMLAYRFNLPDELPEEVHEADAHMLWHEMAAILLPPEHGMEWGMGSAQPAVVRPELVQCWTWQEAERKFLERFKELT